MIQHIRNAKLPDLLTLLPAEGVCCLPLITPEAFANSAQGFERSQNLGILNYKDAKNPERVCIVLETLAGLVVPLLCVTEVVATFPPRAEISERLRR